MNAVVLLSQLTGCAPAMAQDAPDATQDAAGRRFAVVVGVSEYPSLGELTLDGADAEATRVALALREEGNYDDVRILTDAQATREGIEALFRDELSSVVTWQDTVLFYFVGHGVGGDFGDPYLLTYDTTSDDIQASAMSVAGFGQQVQQWIPAGNFVFVTDASHAGVLEGLALTGPSASTWPDMGTSTMLVSASSVGEIAFPGAFSKHFIDAVTGGGDVDENGLVSAAELNRYLVQAVPQDTGNQQNPLVAGRYEADLVVSSGVTFKDILGSQAAPDVIVVTREVEVPGDVIVVTRTDTQEILPDYAVDQVKFVFRGMQSPTITCREQEAVACDPTCYLRDTMAGPCDMQAFEGTSTRSGSVFMAASGTYICEPQGEQGIACKPPAFNK